MKPGDVHDGGFRETLYLLCFSKNQDLRGQLLKNSLILSKTCFWTFLRPMFLSKVCFRALSRNRCFWTRCEMPVRKFNTRHWRYLILGPIGFPSRDAIAHSIFSFASGRALTFIFEQRVTHRLTPARADQAPVLQSIANIFLDLTLGGSFLIFLLSTSSGVPTCCKRAIVIPILIDSVRIMGPMWSP